MKKEGDLEQVKEKLKSYKKKDIIFSSHASMQLVLREGTKKETIKNLLNPEKLSCCYKEKGRYVLHFRISNNKTLILPVTLNRKIFIITYIMRHRRIWKRLF